MSKEFEERVILSMVEGSLRENEVKDKKRRAQELRTNRKREFVRRSEALIEELGVESVDGDRRVWRTPSVEVSDGIRKAKVHVEKSITFVNRIVDKTLAIVTDIPAVGNIYSVYHVIEAYLPRTPKRSFVFNQYGDHATSSDVLKGLQAIKFIERRLRANNLGK